MQFIEMSGKTLKKIMHPGEMQPGELRKVGLTDESVVRINPQGDIELRRADGWDLIGGLIGNYAERIHKETGLKWA
jgi:hypothetical protein